MNKTFLLPLALLLTPLFINAEGFIHQSSIEPIPEDEYVDALVQLGLPILSIDNRPYNPITKQHDPDYSPPVKLMEAAPVHNFVYGKFTPGWGVKFKSFSDPYGFTFNEQPLTSNSHIHNQSDLGGEFFVDQMGFSAYQLDNLSYVDLNANFESINGGLLKTPIKIVLEADEGNNYAFIRIRYKGNHITLTTEDGGAFTLPSKNVDNSKNQIVATLVDNDGDGYDELLAVGYNGIVYLYNLYDIESKYNQSIAASYRLTMMGIGDDGFEAFLQLKTADVSSLAGEELLILAKRQAHTANEPNKFLGHLSILSAGTTGYNSLLSKRFTDTVSNAYAANTFAVGNFNPAEPRKQIALGVADTIYYELKVMVYALDELENGKLTMDDKLFIAKHKKSKWHKETFGYQTSMVAADLLGIGQDYVAFGSHISVYDPSKENLVGVKSFNLGGDASQAMVWTAGHFSDDFNEYTASDLNIARPIQGVIPRKEGEELILTWLDSDANKWSVNKISLIDIDNSIFVDVSTNIEDVKYAELGGVNRNDIVAPTLRVSPDIIIEAPYHRSKPTIAGYDVNDVSVTLKYSGGHAVNFSQPVLTHAIEPVPYYLEDDIQQDADREIVQMKESGGAYSSSVAVSTSVGFDVTIPGISAGLSYAFGQSQEKVQSLTFSDEIYIEDNVGDSPILILEVIPFDRYGYTIFKGPSELNDMIGMSADILIPRSSETLIMTLDEYEVINTITGNKLFSFEHLFNVVAGDVRSYPSRKEVLEKYETSAFVNNGVTVHNNLGEIKVGSAISIGQLTENISGKYSENSASFSIGVEAKGFGFSQSASFAKGLETTMTKTNGRELSVVGAVNGFQSDNYSYKLGAYLAAEKNTKGTEEKFIRGGFWTE
ncbi:hypothetical protein [Shewanella sp. YLB-07]|uniref:hypothetical protein n=1 Tax=Shewanella sp. YLB-07 TaxID=2601268 RepID=UPI00128B0799|nr:hypothetical protein [Shewanella sp. YLB-07]MPY25068.1 hypothetical protein [Shewanella sp. YLB-07]